MLAGPWLSRVRGTASEGQGSPSAGPCVYAAARRVRGGGDWMELVLASAQELRGKEKLAALSKGTLSASGRETSCHGMDWEGLSWCIRIMAELITPAVNRRGGV